MERTWLTIFALVVACLLDLAIGDPRRLPHPVRLLGRVIELLENILRRVAKSAAGLRLAGLLLVVIAAAGPAILIFMVLAAGYRFHSAAGLLIEIYIYFAVLAGGDLRNHLSRVSAALCKGDLAATRSSVALLVSRDTETLGEEALSRASLESLFENSSDGLVAPLFFAAIGGPASAVFYKAVNTLDSMVGYRNEKYCDFGYAAAKLDDLLNFIPARLTAILILIAGSCQGRLKSAWPVLVADRLQHESPNSAWPEAAAAGVLGVRLGGDVYYQGELRKRPVINSAGREAVPGDIRRGLALFGRLSLLAFILLSGLASILTVWGVVKY